MVSAGFMRCLESLPLPGLPKSQPSIRVVIIGVVTTLILFLLITQPNTEYLTAKYDEYFKSGQPAAVGEPQQPPPPEVPHDSIPIAEPLPDLPAATPSQEVPPPPPADPPQPPTPETEVKEDPETKPEAETDLPAPEDADADSERVTPCNELPGAKDVLMVVKTGATEALAKLPIHFTTTLTCVPDYMLFADVEMEIEGQHVHDALDHMGDVVDKNSDEWRFKEALEKVRASGNTSEYKGMSRDEAWKLDKFKNVPMAHKAHAKFPDKKWYVFIDADTSISWSTLLVWLSKFDSGKPYYMGSQVMIGSDMFAHGGSGYVISHEAMRRLAAEDAEADRKHQQFAGKTCCGDLVVSMALRDNGVGVYHSHPIIQGEEPWSLDFTDWHWCHPAVTWHHMTVAEIKEMWEWEQSRLAQGLPPARYADAYDHFIKPKITDAERDGWDNVAEMAMKKIEHKKEKKKQKEGDREIEVEVDVKLSDDELKAIASFEGCAESCQKHNDCKQFTWKEGQCKLASAMRLGKKSKGHRAGWVFERMEKFIKKKGDCAPQWMEDKG